MGRDKKARTRNLYRKRFHYRRIGVYALPILVTGFLLTVVVTALTFYVVEKQERKAFVSTCNEIKEQLIGRLDSHAMMLRAGIAHFTLSGPIKRDQWKKYYTLARINRYLPDIEGMGFVEIIPAGRREQHILNVRKEGFPEYMIFPTYERTVYTSVVYIEPLTIKNKSSLGHDMFTEPDRRNAMEFSRDNNVYALSGRARLSPDKEGEEQYGCLMFVPYYEPGLPVYTGVQRSEAIRGWLFSPFRLDSLMNGILTRINYENELRVQLFDEIVSENTFLYDSHGIGLKEPGGLGSKKFTFPLVFNSNQWHLQISQQEKFPLLAFIAFVTGIIISYLLYLLSQVFSKIEIRSTQIRNKNKELKILNATKDKFFTIIAHDLKSPFNAILGFSDILVTQADKMDREKINKIAGVIRQSANHAVDLLMNLVEWSQSQTGRIKYSPEELNITQIVNEVELLFIDVARQKNIILIKELPDQAEIGRAHV